MKKFKIYSTMLLVALISIVVLNTCSFGATTFYGNENDKLEIGPMPQEFYSQDSTSSGIRYQHVCIEVYVKHKVAIDTTSAITSQISANLDPHSQERQDCLVEMQKVKLSIPWDKIGRKAFFLGFVAGHTAYAVVCIVFVLILAFKVIRMIRKGEIFVSKVARYLEWSGWMLTIFYLISLVGSYSWYIQLGRCIHLKNYVMAYHNETSCWILLIGLILMVLSQIIQMGKELKEEQDLTI